MFVAIHKQIQFYISLDKFKWKQSRSLLGLAEVRILYWGF